MNVNSAVFRISERTQGQLNSVDTGFAPSGKIMFPNAHDAPAELAQFTIHSPVAGFVGGEFLFPERTVANGNFAVTGAAMPETAVHKKRQPVSPKKKVRFAENFLIPPPAGDVVLTE